MLEKTYLNQMLKLGTTLTLLLFMFSTFAESLSSLPFKVHQNTSFDGCPYSEKVAISVDYELTGTGIGELIVSSLRGGQQFLLAKKEVESGTGSAVFVFELSDCIDDINVTLNPS